MDEQSNDTSFEDFVELINALASCNGHKERSSMISRFISDGPNGSLHRDTPLILKLLLPKATQRVYNVQDKQLVKYFSEIFETDKDEMVADLEEGDVAMTLYTFFKQSQRVRPLKKSKVSLKQVDKWLDDLANASGDDARIRVLLNSTKMCTADDYLIFMRLIKKDLCINAGSKQILDALGPGAYAAFQASHDLEAVVDNVRNAREVGKRKLTTGNLSVGIKLMTPIKPMLAEPGRSVDTVIAKGSAAGGMLVEIKYDGERVQVHKQGNKFAYFSRSLRPVQLQKVEHLKEFIPKAFPGAVDLIIDSEVLLLDVNTQKPLPFGTLGVHKRNAFKDATVCLFVFDCLYINGRSLLLEPICKRRELLEQNMTVVPNRVLLSEKHDIRTKDELNDLMARVFAEGLEGLVIKMNDSVYEPGKRHWIKIKKDYLAEGAMADSADLVVLGAYFGTGNKGGMMSVFLMGAFDPAIDQFCTVTKCANGFDDRTLLRLQKQLKMIKISKDYSKVPSWLNVARSMVPDFVVADPKAAPVWEITGAEFSRSGFHTAGTTTDHEGISIRFPRVTRQRPDKSWKEATDVPRLESLFKASRSQSDWSRKLEALSNPSPANKRAAQRDEVLASAKKPRLFRVRESAQFNYLRPLLEGFVINVPGALIGDESFQMLYRRLVACGAVVTGDGLRETTKPVTHTIVVPPNTNPASSLDGVTPLTVDWLEKSINEGKLQPLPANQPQICEM